MSRPSMEHLRYVTTEAAMDAIEQMSRDPKALRALAHDWFPDADEFDLRWIAEGLASGLNGMRGLLENRRQRLIKEGRMGMPGG